MYIAAFVFRDSVSFWKNVESRGNMGLMKVFKPSYELYYFLSGSLYNDRLINCCHLKSKDLLSKLVKGLIAKGIMCHKNWTVALWYHYFQLCLLRRYTLLLPLLCLTLLGNGVSWSHAYGAHLTKQLLLSSLI